MQEDNEVRFSPSDAAETEAVDILRYILDKSRVRLDANVRDKLPAMDGNLLLVEDDHVQGKLVVQIKKLPEKNRESPKKKFDVPVIKHYQKEPAPILFILVDTEYEVGYWEYIDSDFVSNLGFSDGQQTKVIHFDKRPPITADSDEYVNKWHEIAQKRMDALQMNVHSEAYEELRKRANPSVGTQNAIYAPIHCFLDEFNSFLDDIPILSKRFYDGGWKVGLAYEAYEDDFLGYGLFPIPYDLNDVQIKSVNESVLEEINGARMVRRCGGANPIDSHPEEYAREVIDDKLDEVIQKRLLDHRVDEFLAGEIVFAFAENYHAVLGLERRDRYSIQEIKQGYFGYLPYWIDEAIRYLVKNDRQSFDRHNVDLTSLLSQILPDVRDTIDSRVETRILDKSESPPSWVLNLTDLPTIAVNNCLLYLDRTGIRHVERSYNPPDEDIIREQGCRVWEGYDDKEVTQNLETFFDHVEAVFDGIVERNFPGLADELSLFDGASKLIVSYDLNERSNRSPTSTVYYLCSVDEDDEGQTEIHVYRDDSFVKWEQVKPQDKVEFREETYTVSRIEWSKLHFIFGDTPMLDFIYAELESQVSEAVVLT